MPGAGPRPTAGSQGELGLGDDHVQALAGLLRLGVVAVLGDPDRVGHAGLERARLRPLLGPLGRLAVGDAAREAVLLGVALALELPHLLAALLDREPGRLAAGPGEQRRAR